MKGAELRGLGDVVEALLALLRLSRDSECGCHHRRDLLNKMFPFRRRRH
jgi:hypothetical protein